LAEVGRLVNTYLTTKDSLEPVSARELMDRARKGLVIVLDVRPANEYAAGHLMGAVNIPLADLEKHLDKFVLDKEIVAYCRGPHCILAYDAVVKLRGHGIRARRLQGGYPEWKAMGLPVMR
ncbi:MAG: ArsR family transcriptional regulator, partial [Gammaproteobacteria bacterium]|nr:ArsR family transcriptional regulator [Gammaproteobacteria bacterium]